MRVVHPLTASSPRYRLAGVVAATIVAMMTLVPSAAASASTGSIPPDVTSFAGDDQGLLLELEEFFGVDQRGSGIDFSDGIELGAIDRVFLWSNDYHAGEATETPVQYVNRWKVPVLIGEEPIGVALIGFDPATVEPEMIDFIRSPGTALALDDVDDDAILIHEPETDAWFALVDDVITPLVRGSSEVAGETTLAAYQPIVSSRLIEVVEENPQPDQGSVQSVVLIVTTIGVVLLALLIPTVLGKVRERRARLAEEADGPASADQVASDSAGSPDVETGIGVAPVTAAAAKSPTKASAPTNDAPVESESESEAVAPSTARAATKSSQTAQSKADSKKKSTSAQIPSARTATAAAAKIKPAVKSGTATSSGAKKTAPKTKAATKASTTKAPATKTPTTKAPATKTPATKTPATKAPATETPATKTPATKTTADKAAAKKTTAPTVKKPAAKKTAATKPATKKPAATKAAATKPAAKKAATAKPARTKPTSAGTDATDTSAPQ
ncbi:hypothetical protein AB0O95_10910 [Rhodoglobus sp. NPDC076762]